MTAPRRRRRAPLRALRRPVRARDADAGARRARAGVARGCATTTASATSSPRCCATTSAARRRCTSPSASPRPPGTRSTSSARTSATPARTRSTTRSARRCSPAAWASTRIIAETGAGQHGVATATACALLGLECVVYMGTEDMRRQQPNVERMQLLGARVEPVDAGARTLKEAISAAIRDWVDERRGHALRDRLRRRPGAVPGAGPRPAARDRRRGARPAAAERSGRLPDRVIACVGGGSNAIGHLLSRSSTTRTSS